MNDSRENPETIEEPAQQLTLDEALRLAIRLHQANQFEDAEELYGKLLAIDPENPNVLHFFGLLKHQRGRSKQGIEFINRALERVPDYLDAQNNLGNLYLETGQPELAEKLFRQVIAAKPDFAAAYGNLGVALKELDKFEQAIENLTKAIELQPDAAFHYQNLGNVYRVLKHYPEAVAMYRKSLALVPFDPDAYRRLSRIFYVMGEIDRCVDILKQWLEFDPENPTALHMLAAYSGSNAPARASDAYVQQTFDSFAASFDGVLRRLNYQAPVLVQQALIQLQPQADCWTLLDIGCGTGLCGELVRPLVNTLHGVDLSAKMLERAAEREVYDALFQAELTEFLASTDHVYDAVTCVDTLCYFGDLSGVFPAAARALKPNGWFVFTLEKHLESETEAGFRLNRHGRYSHAESYVRSLLEAAGFRVDRIDTAVLRREGGEDVSGLVVTAQL